MLFAALSNAVRLYDAFVPNDFCLHALFGLLTHILFISSMTLHHAQYV